MVRSSPEDCHLPNSWYISESKSHDPVPKLSVHKSKEEINALWDIWPSIFQLRLTYSLQRNKPAYKWSLLYPHFLRGQCLQHQDSGSHDTKKYDLWKFQRPANKIASKLNSNCFSLDNWQNTHIKRSPLRVQDSQGCRLVLLLRYSCGRRQRCQ